MSNEKLKNYLRNATTVGELIAELSKYPENAPVAFGYTASDHWRTSIAERISSVEPMNVKWSGYHDKLEVIDEDADIDEDAAENVVAEQVVVIR